MHILQWLLIPVTAHAILNPAPQQPQKVPLLGENTPYVVDFPVTQENALYVNSEPSTTITDDIYLLKKYFPDNWQIMYKIATCESTNRMFDGSGKVISHINTNGSTDYGYMQDNSSHEQLAQSYNMDYKGNLEDNIHLARIIYDQQGFTAWSCYNIIKSITN